MATRTVSSGTGPIGLGRIDTALCSPGKSRFVGTTFLEYAASLTNKPTVSGEDITLAEHLTRWLSGPLKTRNLKHATIEQYEWHAYNHIIPALGRVKLQRLTSHMLQDLYDEKIARGMAPASVRQLPVVLHSALSHAHKHDVVTQNAAAKTDPPKICPPEIQPLSSDEARSLLSAARGDRLEALYVLAVTAGLRIGELLGLRWEDLTSMPGSCASPGLSPAQRADRALPPRRTARAGL